MDKSKEAIKAFNDNAQGYAEKYMDVSGYARSLDFFCNKVGMGKRKLLDIACGPGNLTQYLLNKNGLYQIQGIDLSPRMLALAKVRNPSANFLELDIRQVKSLAQKFDAIICGFGLPYLTKIEALALLKDIPSMLVQDGLFYLSTMEDDINKSGYHVSSSGDESIFINYHDGEYLKKGLAENGLQLIYEERLPIDGSEAEDLMLIAKKI